MKAIITTLALVFITALSAQNFTGKAIYKTSKKSNVKFGKDQEGITDKMQEEFQKRIQKMNQKTFILNFDKTTSIYKEEEKLEAPQTKVGSGGIKIMSLGGSGSTDVYYKNIQQKRFANKTEIQGKAFLVKDKLKEYEWELSSETKNIGNYTCYKATYTTEVENTTMSMVNGETKETTTKETIVTTSWYTTQIAISNGPKDYQGLPGLILEINDGKNTIVCVEIILNPEDAEKIEEPTKGKVVSLKKYTKIQKQKTEELIEKMKSRNGIDLGNGINIKMGG